MFHGLASFLLPVAFLFLTWRCVMFDMSGLQPFVSFVRLYLGLRPRLVYVAPLALSVVVASFGVDQNSWSWADSKVSRAAEWRRVRPMSSRPLSRQYLRNGSMSKWAVKPDASVTVWSTSEIVILCCGFAVERARRVWTSSSLRRTRMMPFLPALEKKRSAKVGAMTARKPYWLSAQAACSRDDPQPKFRSAMRICEPA